MRLPFFYYWPKNVNDSLDTIFLESVMKVHR